MVLKNNVYAACIKLLDDKIADHHAALHELTAGAGNDSKSSVGDKHETARAMMQLEYEKLTVQMHEVMAQKETLERIHHVLSTAEVIKGSLVKTDKGYLYLSVAIGKISVDGVSVIALSTQSPLGKQLMGKKTNEEAAINNVHYLIQEIS